MPIWGYLPGLLGLLPRNLGLGKISSFFSLANRKKREREKGRKRGRKGERKGEKEGGRKEGRRKGGKKAQLLGYGDF